MLGVIEQARALRAFVCAVLFFAASNAASAQEEPLISASVTEQFGRHAEESSYRIDHNSWSEFLSSAVFDVGLSGRRPAPRRRGGVHTGTRISTGSRSRYRYEGNRLAWHLITDDVQDYISIYRTGLPQVMDKYDYAKFSKNEQLAFWLNLYNAILIDEVAKRYPVARPHAVRIETDDNALLFDAKLTTVNGVALSLNDIRYGVVYRYWKEPEVIYGFWDGSIGGVNIQPVAFTGENAHTVLAAGARRYVNALRGVEQRSGAFRVSEIYDHARGLFPNWPQDLYGHLRAYATDEVAQILENPPEKLTFLPYDYATADFSNGEIAKFGGSDNAAAVLSLKPESGSGVPVDLLENYGAPIGNNTMRGGDSADTFKLKTRIQEERERRRQSGSATISDIDSEDPDEKAGERATGENADGEAPADDESQTGAEDEEDAAQ